MKKISVSTLSCKKILTFLLLVFISLQLTAQSVTNYTFAASSGTFTALSGATSPAFSAGNEDDGTFNSLPIGFDFFYMGTRYTTASASTNGFLVLGGDVGDATTYGYVNNLATWNTPRPVIAPLWDDLAIQVSTNFSYLSNGTAPNRIFTAQWLNAQWDYNATGNTISIQVKLYESTGKVEFVYRSEAGAVNAGSASIGITAIASTGSGSFRSLNNAGATPTVSSTTETTSISAKPTSGRTYGWTPAVPTAPTTLSFTSITTTGMTLNWTDNSANEIAFAIYRSTDGTNYTYISQTAANATSSTQTGLSSSTLYYWRVYAVTEGGLSTALSGSQVTNTPAGTKTFTGTGNFSTAARWSGGTLPVAGDNLIIDGACTVDNSGVTDNVAYGTLVIGTATGRTLNWVAGGTNRLNVSNVSAGAGASTLSMANGGVLIIRGTWTSTNLTFTATAGTIEIRSTMTLPADYTTYYNLIVNGSSTTVTAGVGTTIGNNLTVTSGTFTADAYSLAVTGTASVTSAMSITSATGAKSFTNLVINSGGTFTNTIANVPITIAGNLQNDGTFNQGTGRVTFTGATSNTITGIAATTAFGGGITVNKGTANTNVLDVQAVITMSAGGLTLTNGTFKLSSSSTITAFTSDNTVAPYLIPGTAGLWINGGTVTSTSNITAAGLIRVSDGVFNLGTAADGRLLSAWATMIIEGGAFNITGRMTRRTTGEGHYFTMSGGIFTVNTMGSTNPTYGPFTMDDVGSSFTMSGGSIVVHMTSSAPNDYTNLAGTYNVTGGTLQIGDATTPAGNTININSSVPVWNLLVDGANSPIARLYANGLTVQNDLTIASGTLNANNLNISVRRNWSNNVSSAAFTAGTGTVTLNGTAGQSIAGSFATTFNNLTIASTNTVTSAENCTVSNNLLVSSGTLDLASFTANSGFAGGTLTVSNGATLKIGGTNTIPSNYTAHSIGSTSTIEYGGTTQSVIVLNSAQDYGHLIISGSGTKTLAGTETIAGNLTLSAGTFNANNFNIAVGGHWINNAGFTAGTGTVTFNGGGAQILSGSQALNVYNLVTNNTSGITLNTNLTVNGAHTFSAGIITTSATPNFLIYAAGSSYAGSTDSRHVNGWVKKHGNTNFTFPVGDATYERTTAISNLSAVSEIDCHYYTPTQNIFNLTSPLVNVKANEYWQIDRISGGTAQVTLNWAHAKVAMDNIIVADILVANYSAGSWTSRGGTASGNVTTTGTITSTSTGTFGPFTLGYKTYPIPLKLLSFTAERRSGTSFLKWLTENEENVDRFEIQRSYNGVLYLAIGNVPARNTSSLQHYLFEDHSTLQGLAYYRIRSIDIDGKFSYSNIAVVSENNPSSGGMVVLNPVHSTITILNRTGKSGLFGYRLFNAGGQLLITGTVSMSINGGTALPLPAAASSGIYILEMSYGSNRYRQKILVQ